MGARADYMLIEDGAIDIYYDKWGAQGVPAVVIDGSEATIASIRELAPTESLMDDIWAEGGILLDMDRRELLFFGGDSIRFSSLAADSSPYDAACLAGMVCRLGRPGNRRYRIVSWCRGVSQNRSVQPHQAQ